MQQNCGVSFVIGNSAFYYFLVVLVIYFYSHPKETIGNN